MLRGAPRSTLFPFTTHFRSQRLAREMLPLPHGEVGVLELRLGERRGEPRWEEQTSELQSRQYLVCCLLLEKNSTLACQQGFQPPVAVLDPDVSALRLQHGLF